ncbi:MAG: DnaJ C-terminal domain-containing protein [Saprospiraceae bacterium]
MAKQKKQKNKGLEINPSPLFNPKTQKGSSWFFAIGINEYQEFPKLNNAVKDIENVRDLLTEKYDLDPNCIILLTNEAATRENIVDELNHLIYKVKEIDKLVIYYSGHGHLDKVTERGYWIPHDARSGKISSYIRNSTIRDFIKDIKSLHTLLISDSCFSGSLFVRGNNRSSEALDEWENTPSRWAICSGRHDEEVCDGIPGQNSPFAECILDVLGQNQEKAMNVARLIDRVSKQTRSNYIQLPQGNPLFGVGDKGGQYVFRLKLNETEDWATCQKEGTLAAFQIFVEKYPYGQFTNDAHKQLLILEEEEAWMTAKAAHTIGAYDQYCENYPQGRYFRNAIDEISSLEEEEAWQKAVKKNRLSVFREFINTFPDGEYRAKAEENIIAIKTKELEAEIWQNIATSNKISDFENYLIQYPRGRFAFESKQAIERLQKEEEERQKYESAKIAWNNAKSKHSEETYIQFIADFPHSPFAAEANAALDTIKWEKENDAWSNATKEDSLFAYSDYLTHFPNGKHHLQAQERIKDLEDEKAWLKAKMVNTIATFKDYCKEYPKGRHHTEAQNTISKYEEETAWLNAKKTNTITAYKSYCKEFPQGHFSIDAEEAILKLEEVQDWSKAKSANTIAEYKQYCEKYPRGRFKQNALDKITKLDEEVAWSNAERFNTMESYQDFLNKYPESQYAAMARDVVDTFRKNKYQSFNNKQDTLRREERGSNLRIKLSLKLEEIAEGVTKTIKIKKYTTCQTCGGLGKIEANKCSNCEGDGRIYVEEMIEIDIPAGVEEGMELSLRGKGNAGLRGGTSGDLLVQIKEEPHDTLQRDGMNLIHDLYLNYADAALGTSVEVPTTDGRVKIKVPAATQSGKIYRLKGKGLPSVRDYGKGDELIHVNVWTPKKLSNEEKELMEKMRKLPNFKPQPGKSDESFFDRMRDYFKQETPQKELIDSNLRIQVSLSLEEVAKGAKKTIKVKKQVTCPNCGGSGQMETNCSTCNGDGRIYGMETIEVVIPAGIEEGMQLSLRGKGDAGLRGDMPSDLLIQIQEKPHDTLQRDGMNLIHELYLNFADAALGTSVEVPIIDGLVKIRIPAATQSGKIYRLKGKGLPSVQNYGKGDELIHVNVWTPKKLSDEEQKLLEKIRKLPNFKPQPGKMDESFFTRMRDYFKQ